MYNLAPNLDFDPHKNELKALRSSRDQATNRSSRGEKVENDSDAEIDPNEVVFYRKTFL